jgi:hypothetical protein
VPITGRPDLDNAVKVSITHGWREGGPAPLIVETLATAVS